MTSTGATPNNYLYRSEQYDTDLSLYYLRARYYNPATGRFLSVDSEAGQGQRRYEYAGADPVNGLDPSGNEAIVEFALLQFYPGRLAVHFPGIPGWCGIAGGASLAECGGTGGPPHPCNAANEEDCHRHEVTVSFWPKAACFIGICRGHVGIGVDTNNTTGFYPKSFAFLSPIMNVPGIVEIDAHKNAGDTPQFLHHIASSYSAKMMQFTINLRSSIPGYYNLFDRNCAQFDADVLRAGTIDPLSAPQVPMVDPSQWFNELKQSGEWY